MEVEKDNKDFKCVIDGQCFVVRTAGTQDKPLFCARDVCLILGLENNRQAVVRLKPEETCKIKISTKGGKRNLIFVTKQGLKYILSTSKKNIPFEFLEFVSEDFDINMDVITPSKETQHITSIIYAFADYKTETQYSIGPYRIDLVFLSQKIAIECDENGHRHYNVQKEVERHRFIEQEGYQFVRFNPDIRSFNIGKVIYQIRKLLVQKNKDR